MCVRYSFFPYFRGHVKTSVLAVVNIFCSRYWICKCFQICWLLILLGFSAWVAEVRWQLLCGQTDINPNLDTSVTDSGLRRIAFSLHLGKLTFCTCSIRYSVDRVEYAILLFLIIYANVYLFVTLTRIDRCTYFN